MSPPHAAQTSAPWATCACGFKPAQAAAPVETVADKQQRVKVRRLEEDERRRAKLEADLKAKDDKRRNIVAKKQQQRLRGGHGAHRRIYRTAQPFGKQAPLDAAAEPSTVHAGQKRGRCAADSSPAKPKRPKVQVEELCAMTASSREPGPQTSGGSLAEPIDVIAAAASAPPQQRQAADEVEVGKPPEKPVDGGAKGAYARRSKLPHTQTLKGVRTNALKNPPETAIVSGAVALSPRVTRSRRVQPPAANPQVSPSSAAAKQARVRSTRQRRNMKEVQLGSPGMHTKGKAATESDAIIVQRKSSAAAAMVPRQPIAASAANSPTVRQQGLPKLATTRRVQEGVPFTPRVTRSRSLQPPAVNSRASSSMAIAKKRGMKESQLGSKSVVEKVTFSAPALATNATSNVAPVTETAAKAKQPRPAQRLQPSAAEVDADHLRASTVVKQLEGDARQPPTGASMEGRPGNEPSAHGPDGTSGRASASFPVKAASFSLSATVDSQDGVDPRCKGDVTGAASAPGLEGVGPAEAHFSSGTNSNEGPSPMMVHSGPATGYSVAACNINIEAPLPKPEGDRMLQRSPLQAKALEAAQAAKHKKTSRQAERVLGRAAAVDYQRQGQGDAGPSTTGGRPGAPAPCSVRLTPTKSAIQQGADTLKTCTTTVGIVLPVASTAAGDKRNDCTEGGETAVPLGNVKAKAAFYEQKNEQARKAAAEQASLRKQATGKRLLLNGTGAGASQAAAVYVKPEPENGKMGFVSLNAAKTPGPKLGTAKTPGPKAGPVVSNMVSPAVQIQVKLLPAVHAQPAVAGPEGSKAAGAAPGLPRPKPVGTVQGKQAPVAAVGSLREDGVTSGAADLTEEDRRNVLAIQTSPYVMQVKPRTPAVTTATKPLFNYETSPYRSDSDSDSCDDEEGPCRRRKPVPAWAAEDKVLLAVNSQAGMNADAIFGSYPRTIDVVKVFSDMPTPGDKDSRGRPRRDYRRRGSSGNWERNMFSGTSRSVVFG